MVAQMKDGDEAKLMQVAVGISSTCSIELVSGEIRSDSIHLQPAGPACNNQLGILHEMWLRLCQQNVTLGNVTP